LSIYKQKIMKTDHNHLLYQNNLRKNFSCFHIFLRIFIHKILLDLCKVKSKVHNQYFIYYFILRNKQKYFIQLNINFLRCFIILILHYYNLFANL
jgi:hypothetical protein